MRTYVLVDDREYGWGFPNGPHEPGFTTLQEVANKYHPEVIWGVNRYLVAVEDGEICGLTAEEDAKLRELCAVRLGRAS
jgi:hypothetical protein